MKKTYFLFGKKACRIIFDTESIEDLITEIEDGIDFDLFEFNPETSNPAELLIRYDGWEDYAVITEEEFNKLKEYK